MSVAGTGLEPVALSLKFYLAKLPVVLTCNLCSLSSQTDCIAIIVKFKFKFC